jgi:nicotinamide-nucleotide amidase
VSDLAPLVPAATELIRLCTERGLKVATAESCTGGLIAAALTGVPGSSAVVDRGFVTYSNGAKTEMLGVAAELIERAGAVSEEVAVAMVEGALARSDADLAVAVTGIAGPDGGSPEKPVGLVHFAAMRRDRPVRTAAHAFEDFGRASIRTAAVREALALLTALV